jgi:AraC family transcriptional regulator of adaptative response / DNA-3-methyladenine glycosylase II
VRAILGQQITVAAATRLCGALVRAYGEPIADPSPGLTHVFPAADRLAGIDFAALGMPAGRRAALASLVSAVVADPLLFGPRRSLDEAVAQLRALPGIGEWTAQYIAMRELREPDAFPAADIGLMRALSGSNPRISPAALLARSEAWRPWRAYAALHLWASEADVFPGVERAFNDPKAA